MTDNQAPGRDETIQKPGEPQEKPLPFNSPFKGPLYDDPPATPTPSE